MFFYDPSRPSEKQSIDWEDLLCSRRQRGENLCQDGTSLFVQPPRSRIAPTAAETSTMMPSSKEEVSPVLFTHTTNESPSDAASNDFSDDRAAARFTLIVNVPPMTTRADLILSFKPFGQVELAMVVCDKKTRHINREWTATAGYAFVRFARYIDAQTALAAVCNGSVRVQGRRVRATWAKKDSYSGKQRSEKESSDRTTEEPLSDSPRYKNSFTQRENNSIAQFSNLIHPLTRKESFTTRYTGDSVLGLPYRSLPAYLRLPTSSSIETESLLHKNALESSSNKHDTSRQSRHLQTASKTPQTESTQTHLYQIEPRRSTQSAPMGDVPCLTRQQTSSSDTACICSIPQFAQCDSFLCDGWSSPSPNEVFGRRLKTDSSREFTSKWQSAPTTSFNGSIFNNNRKLDLELTLRQAQSRFTSPASHSNEQRSWDEESGHVTLENATSVIIHQSILKVLGCQGCRMIANPLNVGPCGHLICSTCLSKAGVVICQICRVPMLRQSLILVSETSQGALASLSEVLEVLRFPRLEQSARDPTYLQWLHNCTTQSPLRSPLSGIKSTSDPSFDKSVPNIEEWGLQPESGSTDMKLSLLDSLCCSDWSFVGIDHDRAGSVNGRVRG